MINHGMLIELDFVGSGDLVVVFAPCAPPEGAIVQIKRKDYIAKQVFYTVDERLGEFRKLRATIKLQEL